MFLFLCRYILKDALSAAYHLRLSLLVSIIIISAFFFKHAQPIHHSAPFILCSSLHFLHWFTINMCESEEERRGVERGEAGREGRPQPSATPLPLVRIGALVQNVDQKATNDRRVTKTYLQCTLARFFCTFLDFSDEKLASERGVLHNTEFRAVPQRWWQQVMISLCSDIAQTDTLLVNELVW